MTSRHYHHATVTDITTFTNPDAIIRIPRGMSISCSKVECLVTLQVAVNNSHFIEFQHRNPNLAAIQWVEVAADASNVSIHVQ